MREATTTDLPNRSKDPSIAGPMCRPMRTRIGASGWVSEYALKARCTAMAQRAARCALEKTIMKPSPSDLTSWPRWATTSLRNMLLCIRMRSTARWSPSRSYRDVESSMSENRIATAPSIEARAPRLRARETTEAANASSASVPTTPPEDGESASASCVISTSPGGTAAAAASPRACTSSFLLSRTKSEASAWRRTASKSRSRPLARLSPAPNEDPRQLELRVRGP